MEPVQCVEIVSTRTWREKLIELVQMRRGSVIKEYSIAATPFVAIRALVPLIDYFGMETQIRVETLGEAFPSSAFDHWNVVPGDPLDENGQVGLYEPAHGYQLARDFVLKTRMKKGLAGDILHGL
jgi:U5 small nuclear ribonucleoprotein component